MLATFKFGDFPQICQFAKLKTSPKFPVFRYVYKVSLTGQAPPNLRIAKFIVCAVIMNHLQKELDTLTFPHTEAVHLICQFTRLSPSTNNYQGVLTMRDHSATRLWLWCFARVSHRNLLPLHFPYFHAMEGVRV